MEKNRTYLISGLVVVIILAGTIGWSLGKSDLNKVQEKSTGVVSAQSPEDLFSGEKPKDIITLKVPIPPTFHSGQEVIAEKYGFLEEEGIRLERVGVIPWADQLVALKTGTIDFVSAHPDFFINANKGGVRIKGVMTATFGHPIYPHHDIYVLENSSIKEPKDLIGKKVATSPSQVGSWDLGCGGFYWTAYFKEYNIPKDQVIPVNVPEPQHEQALRQGLVDAITAGPTYSAVYQKKGGFRKLWSSWDVFGNSPVDKQDAEIGMIGFTQEFIDKNPEAVRGLVRAYVKSQAWTNDNHEISAEYIGALNGWPPAVEGEHHLSATGLVRERALQQWIDWYEEIGLLKPGQIKLTDLYTNEFNPYNRYRVNDPVKNPTFYDTYQLEWAKKRDVNISSK